MARRADQTTHRGQFEKNKKRIYASQNICGICGRPVDFGIRYPDPMSPCIDHIIPISKGGHPSDISNLQLAHRTCNRTKSDKLPNQSVRHAAKEVIDNHHLPHCIKWKQFKEIQEAQEK